MCPLLNQFVENVLLDLWSDPRKADFKEWRAVTTLEKHFCTLRSASQLLASQWQELIFHEIGPESAV